MAFESDEDLAGLFQTADFAEACTYSAAAGGQPVALDAIVNRPVERRDLGALGVQAAGPEALILASALEEGDPAEGDELAVTATEEVFTVRRATREAGGKIWRLALRAVE